MAERNKHGMGMAEGLPRSDEPAGGVMDTVKEKAQDLASGASELAGRAGEKVQEWASSAQDMAGEAWDSFTNVIRRNPIPSVLIALGVGFLLAQAIRS